METRTRSAIAEKWKEVESLDDDRILTRFLNLIDAMVRTNFFQKQRDRRRREAMAFKFESSKIDGLPLPHPLFEIFVYSPRLRRASALWTRCAWRNSLVRPTAGLSHRGAWPRKGLQQAEDERRDCPGQRQGGFFPKAPARASRSATRGLGPEGAEWRATSCSTRRCSIFTDNIDAARIARPPDTLVA